MQLKQPALAVRSRLSLTDWLAYFRANQSHRLSINWDEEYCLTSTEKQAISQSIQKFQLGESSEGSHLMKMARLFAHQSGDLCLVEIMKLFIGEEQRHARDLGKFMQQQQISLAKKDWTDSIFRRLRRLAGLEMAAIILLTAELVAIVYYKALGQATQSQMLQQLCQQIHQDEVEHTYFQGDLLQYIRQNRPNWLVYFLEACHRLFFSLTLFVVWFDHRTVFQAAGYSFYEFWQESQQNFQRVSQV